MGPDKVAADRAGHLHGPGLRVIINALVDEDAPGCMEVVGLAADQPLKATGAHGALLEEGRGKASFAQGGASSDSVVTENDDGLREVEF